MSFKSHRLVLQIVDLVNIRMYIVMQMFDLIELSMHSKNLIIKFYYLALTTNEVQRCRKNLYQ